MAEFRKHLSAPTLISTVRGAFSKIKDHRSSSKTDYSLADSLTGGLAIFSMKYPSLLQFEKDKVDPVVATNLKNLYGLKEIPSDTRLREILDPVEPQALRPAFKKVFAKIQDGKALVPYRFIDDSHLVAIDGTGFFSSHEVHCDNCCVKETKDGTKTYYHQMLGAVVVNPSQKQVIPLLPEPIIKQDGATKNDCEQNAAKRLLPAIRKDHPHLKITLVLDSLYAKAPTIRLAESLNMGYIIVAKPGDQKVLFSYLEDAQDFGAVARIEVEEGEVLHKFEFINDVPLNDSNPDLKVNVLRYSEIQKDKQLNFVWITSIWLNEGNVYQVMRGGRSRWSIENETFNTLKNQGYQFEHNFGHGYKNLSTVFACLMMLAFLIDQAQELSCPVFREFFTLAKNRKYVWEKLRSFFLVLAWESWQQFYQTLLARLRAAFLRPKPNTS